MSVKFTSKGLADGTDSTKELEFNVAGVTTGTTRTITVPNGDTKLYTGDGTSGQILTSNGAGTAPTFQAAAGLSAASDAEVRTGTSTTKAVTPANIKATQIGWGQTWTNVTSSRATGTTYTNSTGRPIFISVSPTASTQLIGAFYINNTYVAISQDTPSGGGGSGSNFTYVIPNSNTYRVVNTSNWSINQWWELR